MEMRMYRERPDEARLIRVDWDMSPVGGYSRSTTTRELLDAEASPSHPMEDEVSEPVGGAPIDLIFSIKRTVLVRRRKEDLYLSWLFAQSLPMFMNGVVTRQDNEPIVLQSEVQIVSEEDGEMVSWNSLPGSEFTHSGWVRFESALEGEATVLWIQIESTTPPGLNAREFYRELEEQVDHDLLVIKQRYESPEGASGEWYGDDWRDAA